MSRRCVLPNKAKPAWEPRKIVGATYDASSTDGKEHRRRKEIESVSRVPSRLIRYKPLGQTGGSCAVLLWWRIMK